MKTIEKIETYLEGSLKGTDLNEFIHLMEIDTAIAEEVKFHQEINKSIIDDDLQDFRQLANSLTNKKTSAKTRYIHIFSSAAAVALLITLSILSLNKSSRIDRVFTDFYIPYQTDLNTRSATLNAREFEEGYYLYQKGEYQRAFILLEKYNKTVQNNSTAKFYFGLCAIEIGNYTTAEQFLNSVIKEANSPFSIHAKWYLSLLYFKTNRTNEALLIMKQLASSDNFYSKNAKSILNRYY